MKTCTKCQKELDDNAVFCVGCGYPFPLVEKRSWVATILLCLFLGGFGAHRFYTGHIGTAVIMLVLTLTVFGAFVSGIWALYDLIMIILKKFTDSKGNPLAE